jgi:hypothetical protein
MSAKALVRLLGILIAVGGVALIVTGFQRDQAAGACSSSEPGETECSGGPGDPLLALGFVTAPLGVLAAILLPYAVGRAVERRIRRGGVDATATVLAVRRTGVEVVGRPLYELLLDVQPADGGPAHQTTVRTYLTGFGAPRPGDRLAVRCDPADPSRIALLSGVPGTPTVPRQWTSSPPGPPVAAVDELSRLAALHRSGELSDAEFEEMKRRVVNGPR